MGGSWSSCHSSLPGYITASSQTFLDRRDESTSLNVFSYLGNDKALYNGTSKCYHDDSAIGKSGWLSNTIVRSRAAEACTGALKAAAQTQTFGSWEKKLDGFFDMAVGPFVKSGIKMMVSVKLKRDANIDINHLGHDLCVKGIEHLTSDKGCTTPRKAGIITAHTSVNGGLLQWAHGERPVLAENGACTNCFIDLFLEAINKVKIGK